MNKKECLMYLKLFSKISISKICNELEIDKSNLYHLRISEEKMQKVVNNIDKKIQELYEFKEKCKSEEE